jgi:hypothetical protein
MMGMHERLKALIEANTNTTKRYKELEELTGIASETWRTYFTRGVRPTGDLIEAAARTWPQHAFWLTTGIDDSQYQHYDFQENKRRSKQAGELFKSKSESNKTLFVLLDIVRAITNLLKTARAVGGIEGQIIVLEIAKRRLAQARKLAVSKGMDVDFSEPEELIEQVNQELLIRSFEIKPDEETPTNENDSGQEGHSQFPLYNEGDEPLFSVEEATPEKKSKPRKKAIK